LAKSASPKVCKDTEDPILRLKTAAGGPFKPSFWFFGLSGSFDYGTELAEYPLMFGWKRSKPQGIAEA
jgi:hypothetical protein